MNVFALLEASARRHPDADAVFTGTVRHASYNQLLDRSLRLAGYLSSRFNPGARVVLAAANCPEYLEIMFGIWAAGLIAVPVNAKLHPREIIEIVKDCTASLIFASAKLSGSLGSQDATLVTISGAGYDQMLLYEPAPCTLSEPDDAAWLFFTSGTTGRSKGAILTHRNLLTMTIAHLADFENLRLGDSIIHAAPMSHGSGLYILPYAARAGRHVIPSCEGFNTAEFLELARIHPGAGVFLAPTMLRRLRLEVERSSRPRPELRSIIYGGGPMYLDDLKRSLDVFGPILRQLYGQGEAPMTISGLRCEDHLSADDAILASVGWPRTGVQVQVVNGLGAPVATGEKGEIVCRGDVVMRGYWNDPEGTAMALRAGWLHTGDLGSFSPTGCLTLHGRSKELIISGGTNIYPREVEEVLIAHPEVAEASVVGIADPEWGEMVVAAIVREPGCKITPAALDVHCLSNIARFKRPKKYLFFPYLPKNGNGKVLKRELMRAFEDVTAR